MKVAIMQPYFMPYIGYWQLINAVDIFVVYDDVNFIKQGYINRNNILLNGKSHMFSIPVKNISSNKLIKNHELGIDQRSNKKFLKLIESSYKKAPYYKELQPLIMDIMEFDEKNLSHFILNSIKKILEYLEIKKEIILSSEIKKKNSLKGKEKVIEICRRLEAKEYINAIGGKELYCKEEFEKGGINLKFIKAKEIKYQQLNNEFIPFLSIIDILMFNSKEEVINLLKQYNFE